MEGYNFSFLGGLRRYKRAIWEVAVEEVGEEMEVEREEERDEEREVEVCMSTNDEEKIFSIRNV